MKYTEIDASLTYGRALTGVWRKFTYICEVYSLLLFVYFLIFGIAIHFYREDESLQTIIYVNILILSFFLVELYIIKKGNKLNKQIELWLLDAVETKAETTVIDTFGRHIQIEIRFEIDNQAYIKTSGYGKKSSQKYNVIFNKYANKTITILYSPKYDQVLIPREQSKQTAKSI